MTGSGNFLEYFRMPAGMLANREKQRLGTLIGERLEDAGRIARPWAIVESQHDFMIAQEVVSFKMLETETRAAGGVDLHHARNAERIRIIAGRRRGCRSGGWSGGRRGHRRGSWGLRVLCPGGNRRRYRHCQSYRQSAAHHVLHTR